MHNELTKKDIQMMKEELDYRRIQLRPQLLEAVKEARAFGDLSENFEYKAAKQEKNRNESRIWFLENMIKTAVVLPDAGASDGVQLYDRVTVFLEDEGDTEVYQVSPPCGRTPSTASSARSPLWGRPCWAGRWGRRSTSRSTTPMGMTRW